MANENYKGSIELISGLTQANNNDFPLVDSAAVYTDVAGSTNKRLNLVLEELIAKGVNEDDIKAIIRSMGLDTNVDRLLGIVSTGYTEYEKTTDTSVDLSKTYYTLTDGVYTEVTAPVNSEIENYYVATGDVDSLQDKVSDLENKETVYTVQYDTTTQSFTLYEVTLVTSPVEDDLSKYYTYKASDGTYNKATEFDTSISYYTLKEISSTIIPYDASKIAYSISASINGASSITALQGKTTTLSYNFSVVDSDREAQVNTYGSASYYINNTLVKTEDVLVGSTISWDVTDSLKPGTNTAYVVLSWSRGDDTARSKTLTWGVKSVSMYLTSSFDDSEIQTGAFNVYYTPFGSGLAKVVYTYLDDVLFYTDSVGTLSNVTRSVSIPAQSHGSHQLKLYCTTVSNGETISSEVLYFDVMCAVDGNTTPIIRTNYDYQSVTQYDTKAIEYSVYAPSLGAAGVSSVTLSVNDSVVSTVSAMNGTVYTWNYKPGNEITYAQEDGVYTETEKVVNLKITCGSTEKVIALTVEKFPYDITQVTSGLVLDFNPVGKSNNDSDAKTFTYGDIDWTVSDNFDWINGGYQTIDDENCFVVKSGTSVTFNYALFGNNPLSSGRELKVIYKVLNVKKLETSWLTCLSDDKTLGLNMRPHETYVSHDGGQLYHPLSEEDIIEFDMNLFRSGAEIPMVMTYEDGCPAYPLIYSDGNTIAHNNYITIGSEDCDVYIYRLKAYSTNLTDEDILTNYEADARTSDEMISRYTRNQIYDYEADSSLYADNLTPEGLSKACPDLRVIAIETPYFTNGKKYFYGNTHVKCYYENGTRYDDNWEAWNCVHAGQGTSSDGYGPSGRNIDIYMCIDGDSNGGVKSSDGLKLTGSAGTDLAGGKTILKYANAIYMEVSSPTIDDILTYYTYDSDNNIYTKITEDTKANYISDDAIIDGTYYIYTDTISDGTGKVSLTSTSIPNNIFNIKVNIASSENANNALLQKRFDRYMTNAYTPYEKVRDSRIKGSMEFFNCVVFLRETDETTSVTDGETVYTQHREFNDTKWHFYAIGNIGDSKKTDSTRANDPDDKNEFTLELTDWNHALSNFPMGDTWCPVEIANEQDDDGIYSLRYLTNKNVSKGYIYKRSGSEGAYTYTKLVLSDYAYTKVDSPVAADIANYYILNEDGSYSAASEFAEGTDYYTAAKVETANAIDFTIGNTDYDSANVTISDGETVVSETFFTQAKYIPLMEDYDDAWNYDARYKGKNKSYKYVWPAFYNFVTRVISTEAERIAWVKELKEWFAGSGNAVFFWYLFTLRYTMVDNRGKNTFWHWGKTGTYHSVSNPIKSMLPLYAEKDGDNYTITSDTDIDASKDYYCQYALDFWDYDNDTALGINNIGVLAMDYGVEDGINADDFDNNVAHFRCHDSTLFVRVRDWCSDELSALYASIATASDCWTASSLISEFDTWQSQFPEALWHLDYVRKYKRPYLHGSTLPANTYDADTSYLTGKMNGRKKYQRRQFERDQWFYFASKFNTAPFNSSIINFRGSGVKKNSAGKLDVTNQMTLTAYSKMYIKVTKNQVTGADAVYSQRRLSPGESATVTFTEYADGGLDLFYVYGADHISSLGDLSKLYLQEAHIGSATKLNELILGNSDSGYSNEYFPINELAFGSNALLEKVNLQNMGALEGTLNLSTLSGLKELDIRGTNIAKVNFANGGMLTKAYMPSTLTSLTLKNLSHLTTLTFEGTDAIANVNIQNCSNLNTYNLVSGLTALIRLTLTGINWNSDYNISDATLLNSFLQKSGYDEADNEIAQALLTGSVYIDALLQSELSTFNDAWPRLTVTYNPTNFTAQYPVYFLNDDGDIWATQWVNAGDYATKPSTSPAKADDAQYSYTFNTWVENATGDKFTFSVTKIYTTTYLKATYNATLRKYTVKWYKEKVADSDLLATVSNVDYGTFVEYPNDEIPSITTTSSVYKLFEGWDTDTSYITSDTNVIAQWSSTDVTNYRTAALSNLTVEQISAVTKSYHGSGQITQWTPGVDTVDIQLGYLPTYDTSKEHIFISEETEFTGDSDERVDTGYKLFDTDKDWTLAIDYEFSYSSNIRVLAGCANGISSEATGFVLYSDTDTSDSAKMAVYVRYGSKTLKLLTPSVGSGQSYRDMVVIKHTAGLDNAEIKVYYTDRYSILEDESGLSGKSLTLVATPTSKAITNTLSLGGIAGQTTSAGLGYLYNVKYYEYALSDADCKRMASWIYEKKTFELYNNKDADEHRYGLYGSTVSSSASFIATELLDRTRPIVTTSTNEGGFGSSDLKEWLNTKFIKAFPQNWQSAFCKINFKTNTGAILRTTEDASGNTVVDTGASAYGNSATTDIYSTAVGAPCFLTIPTLVELCGTNAGWGSGEYYKTEDIKKQIDSMSTSSSRIKYLGGKSTKVATQYFTATAFPYGTLTRTNSAVTSITPSGRRWHMIATDGTSMSYPGNATDSGILVCFHL